MKELIFEVVKSIKDIVIVMYKEVSQFKRDIKNQ